jgi:hypothetical protein
MPKLYDISTIQNKKMIYGYLDNPDDVAWLLNPVESGLNNVIYVAGKFLDRESFLLSKEMGWFYEVVDNMKKHSVYDFSEEAVHPFPGNDTIPANSSTSNTTSNSTTSNTTTTNNTESNTTVVVNGSTSG